MQRIRHNYGRPLESFKREFRIIRKLNRNDCALKLSYSAHYSYEYIENERIYENHVLSFTAERSNALNTVN